MKAPVFFQKLKTVDKHILASVVLFVLVFLSLAAFWNQPCFISDEAEIFMHGQSIANGKLLYSEIGSQHMPVMYYLAAFFSILGVHSIIGFRLCFYVLMALLFAIIYYVYGKAGNRLGLFLFPFIYVLLVTEVPWRASVMSDQLQGIGMAILLLEYLSFVEDRKLSLKSCIMISLAVFISFGSAFVSVFAIFIMAVSVISYDVASEISGKNQPKAIAITLLKKYGRLFGIVLLPLVAIAALYIFTGRFGDFINWAYRLNVDIYPKYLGYGSNIFQSLFGGYEYFFDYIRRVNFFNMGATDTLRVLAIFFAVWFVVKFSRSGKFPAFRAVSTVLFIVACMTRGLFDFHGVPAIIVIALCAGIAIGFVLPAIRGKSTVVVVAVSLFVATMISPYGSEVLPNLVKITDRDAIDSFERNPTVECVDALTERGERVGFSTLDCDVIVMAGVIPASVQAGSVPWFWEQAGEQAMSELLAAPPRVFVFYEHQTVWGYSIKDYAPELVAFVKENYVQINESLSTVWVLKSYHDEALEILNGTN